MYANMHTSNINEDAISQEKSFLAVETEFLEESGNTSVE